jgi:hypothetical protein
VRGRLRVSIDPWFSRMVLGPMTGPREGASVAGMLVIRQAQLAALAQLALDRFVGE